MPRKLRIESRDHIYHVINRGNNRSFIFRSAEAKISFQETLFEACQRNSWHLLAYSILSNHFHLCLATPKGNLSEGMRWLQATFATRMSRLRAENGHLFQGRFRSLVVEPGIPLARLVDYIHLTALRAGLESVERLGSYGWSSLHQFPERQSRPTFMHCSWMENRDAMNDTAGGWARYKKSLRVRAKSDAREIATLEKEMNRGWCIGTMDFKRKLAAAHLRRKGPAHLEHKNLKEFNQLQWEAYFSKALKAVEKRASDLTRGNYSEAWKLAIASKMKRETSVTNQWLSDRLNMGVANGVSSNCGIYRKSHESSCPYASRLRTFNIEHRPHILTPLKDKNSRA